MIIHNSNPNLLVVFEAKALHRFKDEGIKKGDMIFASLMPNKHYYLSKYGVVGTSNMGEVFETNAVENVDFERV